MTRMMFGGVTITVSSLAHPCAKSEAKPAKTSRVGLRSSIVPFSRAGSDSPRGRDSRSEQLKGRRHLPQRSLEPPVSVTPKWFQSPPEAAENRGCGAFASPRPTCAPQTAGRSATSSQDLANFLSVPAWRTLLHPLRPLRSWTRLRRPSVPPMRPRLPVRRGTRRCRRKRLDVPRPKRTRVLSISFASRGRGGLPLRARGLPAETSGAAHRLRRQQSPGLRLHRHLGRCDRTSTTLRHAARPSRGVVPLDGRAAPRGPSPPGTAAPGCGR